MYTQSNYSLLKTHRQYVDALNFTLLASSSLFQTSTSEFVVGTLS